MTSPAAKSRAMYAVAPPPEREFIAAYVRLSSLPSVPGSSSFPVKSIVKKYKEGSGDVESSSRGSNADPSAPSAATTSTPPPTLLSTAEWAEELLLNNVAWLVQLAVRSAPRGRDARADPVLVSLGGEADILILWDGINPLAAKPSATATAAPAHLATTIRRVNVAISLSTDSDAVALDGHHLVERYGCLQPRDCLYEHVRCELDFHPDARPTLYLSTERAPWSLLSPVESKGASAPGRPKSAKRRHKLRVLRIHTSSTGRAGSFVPERVESLPNPDAYVALAYYSEAGHGGARIDDHESDEEGVPPPSATTAVAAAPRGQAKEDDDDDDNTDAESHGGSEEGAPLPQGFTPREMLMLVRAFRGEPYSDKELTRNLAKVTQKDLHECDRILREDVKGPRKARSSSVSGAAAPAEAAGVPDAAAAKSRSGGGDGEPAVKKKLGRPKGSKNKPKDGAPSAAAAGGGAAAKKPAPKSPPRARPDGTPAPAAGGGTEPVAKKKMGRPKGSKNKPKDGKAVSKAAAGAAAGGNSNTTMPAPQAPAWAHPDGVPTLNAATGAAAAENDDGDSNHPAPKSPPPAAMSPPLEGTSIWPASIFWPSSSIEGNVPKSPPASMDETNASTADAAVAGLPTHGGDAKKKSKRDGERHHGHHRPKKSKSH